MATFTQMKDDMKTCPYNPLHKVAARRLQAHIVKCSRNPDNPVMVDCPFNALHKVLPQDLQQHILLCKDSRQVIREIEESRNRPAVKTPVILRTELPPSSDDWDEGIDKNHATYVTPGLMPELENAVKEGPNGVKETPFQIKSNIQIQRMIPSERKKYYKELAEKARAKELPQTKSEIRIKEERERPSTSSGSQSKVLSINEDNPNNVRHPTTIPFKKIGGVGRGNTTFSNRSAVSIRSVGSSPSSLEPLGGRTVKREKSDDFNRAKRFSPDLE